jgi:hypothetical protein
MKDRDSIKVIKRSGFTARLEYDTDPGSPREWDNGCKMVCWHRRYNLGDEQPKQDPHEYRASLARQLGDFDENTYAEDLTEEQVQETLGRLTVMLPLYLYDHSGITMSCAPFSCPWDSGQVGFAYMTAADIVREYGQDTPETREKARKLIMAEVQTYDEFLTGQVYGYVVEDRHGDHVDSCWGFYGEKYALEEMESALDSAIAHVQKTREEAIGIAD